MSEFPYTSNTNRIKQLFAKIKASGVPDKITLKTLEAWGLKSKNDRALLPIIKFIGLTDTAGTPTENWTSFRSDKTGKAILAQLIRTAYASLYQLYPDAHQKDNEALRHFFSTNSKVGANALEYMVRTFKTLCESADFEAEPITVDTQTAMQQPKQTGLTLVKKLTEPSTSGITINVNIQLTLPSTDDKAIYDNLFAAMKKHILS